MPITPMSPGVQQAGKLITELQKQIKPTGPGGHSFGQVLQNKQGPEQVGGVQSIQKVDLEKMQKVPSSIKSLFNTWSKDSNSMNKIMKVALSGQSFTPSQLIGLQQATYKITFEMETMSKLVEQASSAVKTTMQTQV